MSRGHSFSVDIRKKLIEEKGTICCNCQNDAKNEITFHHIIPVAIGGTDNFTNIVPLCTECHKKLHNILGKNEIISHSELIKNGMKKAKENGIVIGRKKFCKENIPTIFVDKYYPLICEKKITIVKVAKEMKKSRTTIYKYISYLENSNN